MNEPDQTGRFLASQVYARWRWTVRFGLMTVPVITLVFGLIELYLTPSKYQSTCVFSVVHGPLPEEIAELARSREVVRRVVDRLNLQNAMNCDRESALQIVTKKLQVKVIPGTRRIELKCELTRKETPAKSPMRSQNRC